MWAFGGRDLEGFRNDLWQGSRVEEQPPVGDQPEIAWKWKKYEFPAMVGAAPPKRAKSALFYDPNSNRLVLWGGDSAAGPSNDLWIFDFDTWTWACLDPWGDVPPSLIDFTWAQGFESGFEALPHYEKAVPLDGRAGPPYRHVGYIYGGMLPD